MKLSRWFSMYYVSSIQVLFVFSAVAPFICLNSVSLRDRAGTNCDKNIAHTNLPHFQMKFFVAYAIVSSLFSLHSLSVFLLLPISMCHCFRTLFNIYSKNRKENSKSTLQFSANAMRSKSNAQNSFNVCERGFVSNE